MDPRMLELLNKYLKAGQIDTKSKRQVRRDVGLAEGGILSPILCNIVMQQFDEYMNKLAASYEKGKKRRHNPIKKIERQRRNATTMLERKKLLQLQHCTKTGFDYESNIRRLRYIRYADDFVILTKGSRNEAEMIKLYCKDVLKNRCGALLNEDKTVIRHLQEEKKKFQGEIDKLKRSSTFNGKKEKRSRQEVRAEIKAALESLLLKLKATGFLKQNNKQDYQPQHQGALVNLSHNDILAFYNSKIHGIYNFYSFSNLNKLGRISWFLLASCALTLARKLKLGTMRKVFQKFGNKLTCPVTGKEFYKPDNKVKHHYKIV